MSHDGLIHPSRDWAEQVTELEAQIKTMSEALEKLARLGNEPHLGNSIGNIIAQTALAATKPRESNT